MYYFKKIKKRSFTFLRVYKKYFNNYSNLELYKSKQYGVLLYKKNIKNIFLFKNIFYPQQFKSFKKNFKNFIFKKIVYFFKTKIKNINIIFYKKKLEIKNTKAGCSLFEFLIGVQSMFNYLSKFENNSNSLNIFKFVSQKYLNFLLILDYLLTLKFFNFNTKSIYFFYNILRIFKFYFIGNFVVFKKNTNNRIALKEFLLVLSSLKLSLLLDFIVIVLLSYNFNAKILKHAVVKILNLYNFLIKKKFNFYFNFKNLTIHSPSSSIFLLFNKYLKKFKPTVGYSSKLVKVFCNRLELSKYSYLSFNVQLLDTLYFNFSRIKKIYLFLNKFGKLIQISFIVLLKSLNFTSSKFILNFIFKCISVSNKYIFCFLSATIKKPAAVFLSAPSEFELAVNKKLIKKKINFFKNKKKIFKIKLKSYRSLSIFKINSIFESQKTITHLYNYSKTVILRLYSMVSFFDLLKRQRTPLIPRPGPNTPPQDNNYIQFFKEYGSIWIFEYIRHYSVEITQAILNKDV